MVLASLYTIKDHMEHPKEKVHEHYEMYKEEPIKKEIDDVLPAYQDFKELKRKYQLGEIEKAKVLKSFDVLLLQIRELIQILYRNSDMPEERERLSNIISEMSVGNI